MSRYTGPRLKVLRALGVDLPGLSRKSMQDRPTPPGQHGLKKMSGRKSEFGQQLMEKQKLRYNYGLTEGQANEISRLKALNAGTAKRLADLESGHAIIELGRKLIELSEVNHTLSSAAQRVWCLEKTIQAAHDEYRRLSSERDALALQIHGQQPARQHQNWVTRSIWAECPLPKLD